MKKLSHSPLSTVYDFYTYLLPSSLTCIYNGYFSEHLNNKIFALAESNLNNIGEKNKVAKKIYFIMVESLQNITRHQESPSNIPVDFPGFFMFKRIQNGYYLTTCNLIDNKNIELLQTKLDNVNSMDPESLKSYAQEILAMGMLSEKGGAGLGLIEMARKSGNKLFYDFVKLNKEKSFFYFQTKISGENESASGELQTKPLSAEKDFHQLLSQKNIHFIYQGDLNQENVMGLLAVIQSNFKGKENHLIRKKIFNIMVELLQNISKHADNYTDDRKEKSGIFTLGKDGSNYLCSAGNLILNSKISALKEKIDHVNSLTFPELDSLYNKIIIQKEKDGQRGSGLGLIDMRIKSENTMNYYFHPVYKNYSFFSIQAVVPSDKN